MSEVHTFILKYLYCTEDKKVQTSTVKIEIHKTAESKLSNRVGHNHTPNTDTVLVLIKLTKIAVALQLRCGSCKLIF